MDTTLINMAKATQSKEEKRKTTFNLQTQLLRKLKYISFKDEIDMTEIVEESLTNYISKWEKKNGSIKE